MSGYLRRLVATARPHEQSINPITRPLYATQQDQALPLIQDEEVSLAPLIAQTLITAPRVQRPATDAAPSPEQQTTSSVPAIHETTTVAEDERIFEPLPRVRRPLQSLETKMESFQRSGPQAPFKESSHAPLVFEPARAGSKSETISLPKPNGSNFSAPRYEPLKQRSVPEKESDEIQIHIGRIEVTAVPPPVVRPQSKPAPKTPSLDEYLKRGRS